MKKINLDIHHSKVFFSALFIFICGFSGKVTWAFLDLKETKSAKIFKQRVINIYLENYERVNN